MVKIYLDENDIVRVDATADGRMAREAGVNRDMLKMADLLEDLAHQTARVARRRGRSTAVHAEAIGKLGRIRTEIRAGAATRC